MDGQCQVRTLEMPFRCWGPLIDVVAWVVKWQYLPRSTYVFAKIGEGP